MSTYTLFAVILALPVSLQVHAEESAPVAAFPKLNEKVAALGVRAQPVPERLYGGQPASFSKQGMPVVPNLKLTYAPDDEKMPPDELSVELAPGESTTALELMKKWALANAEQAKTANLKLDSNGKYRLKFSGLAARKLADLQFTEPIEGDKKRVEEYRLTFRALTARQATLLVLKDGQESAVATVSTGVVLGAEHRQMEVKVRKNKVKLNEKEPVMRLGKKPRDPRYKRVTLAMPRPESGDDPSVLMATVGRVQLQCEIVRAKDAGNAQEGNVPRGWSFRGRNGATAPELILPSQFDGREALGVFIRVLDHKKDPFSPRTRETKLEVMLVETMFIED